ncbi:hypothetical protein ACFPN4_12555 [Ureibacillus thermophilus]
MIGAIIGDIVGSRFEFKNYRKKDFDLFTKDCKVTDDSIMTLAVAKSIMTTPAVFVPFVGAVIGMKEQPKSAKDEAFLAYMGPLFGLLAIFACHFFVYVH